MFKSKVRQRTGTVLVWLFSGFMIAIGGGWSTEAGQSSIALSGTNTVGRSLLEDVRSLLRDRNDVQVIQAYIAHWSQPFLVSGNDLAALRREGATPALMDTYARRGAELRLRASLDVESIGSGTNAPQIIIVPVGRWSGYRTSNPSSSNDIYPYLFSDALHATADLFELRANSYALFWGAPWRAWGWNPWWRW